MDWSKVDWPTWIQAIAGAVSAVTAFIAVRAANSAAKSARQAESRTLIVQIAERISPLPEIAAASQPGQAVKPAAQTSLNVFEMVGYLCEAHVLDETLVERIWGDFIVRSCNRIAAQTYADQTTGADLLNNMTAAKRLAERIQQAQSNRTALTPP